MAVDGLAVDRDAAATGRMLVQKLKAHWESGPKVCTHNHQAEIDGSGPLMQYCCFYKSNNEYHRIPEPP
jgi:hypothetical protein